MPPKMYQCQILIFQWKAIFSIKYYHWWQIYLSLNISEVKWINALNYLSTINYIASHIFQEDSVADKLTSYGINLNSSEWWLQCPDFCNREIQHNLKGLQDYAFGLLGKYVLFFSFNLFSNGFLVERFLTRYICRCEQGLSFGFSLWKHLPSISLESWF